MKIIIVILSLFVFSSTLIPSFVSGMNEGCHQHEHQHQHSGNHSDDCSLLCSCLHCDMPVMIPQLTQLEQLKESSISLGSFYSYSFPYSFDYHYQYSYGLWHPPTLFS